MSSFKIDSADFKHFVYQKIKSKQNQLQCSKLRSVSKNNNSYFEEAINSANVKYEQLKELANSKFAKQIQNLKLSVPLELNRLDDLCFISTKYFENIQSVKLRFENQNTDNNRSQQRVDDKKIVLKENLVIRGLTFQNHSQVRRLQICGKYDVNIQNSKFNGVKIFANENANVQISHVKILNLQSQSGFKGNYCTSIVMKDVFFKNCYTAVEIYRCQNVFASNINVKQCKNNGFWCSYIQNFQISNAQIFECKSGLRFANSNGKIIDVIVKECQDYGVFLYSSQVRYERYQCINNVGNDVEIRGDGSAFVQGV